MRCVAGPYRQDDDTSPQTPSALGASLRQGTRISEMTDLYTVVRKENGAAVAVAMTVKGDPGLKLVALGRCYDCYSPHGIYMVKDHVWETAWPDHRDLRKKLQGMFPTRVYLELCVNCLVLRLGRPLTLDDLEEKPINDCFFVGYAMGRASLAAGV